MTVHLPRPLLAARFVTLVLGVFLAGGLLAGSAFAKDSFRVAWRFWKLRKFRLKSRR